jgi:hypothetical protein
LYSKDIQFLLEIYREWGGMIEETAYHVLAVGEFETRGIHSDFGRMILQHIPQNKLC